MITMVIIVAAAWLLACVPAISSHIMASQAIKEGCSHEQMIGFSVSAKQFGRGLTGRKVWNL